MWALKLKHKLLFSPQNIGRWSKWFEDLTIGCTLFLVIFSPYSCIDLLLDVCCHENCLHHEVPPHDLICVFPQNSVAWSWITFFERAEEPKRRPPRSVSWNFRGFGIFPFSWKCHMDASYRTIHSNFHPLWCSACFHPNSVVCRVLFPQFLALRGRNTGTPCISDIPALETAVDRVCRCIIVYVNGRVRSPSSMAALWYQAQPGSIFDTYWFVKTHDCSVLFISLCVCVCDS